MTQDGVGRLKVHSDGVSMGPEALVSFQRPVFASHLSSKDVSSYAEFSYNAILTQYFFYLMTTGKTTDDYKCPRNISEFCIKSFRRKNSKRGCERETFDWIKSCCCFSFSIGCQRSFGKIVTPGGQKQFSHCYSKTETKESVGNQVQLFDSISFDSWGTRFFSRQVLFTSQSVILFLWLNFISYSTEDWVTLSRDEHPRSSRSFLRIWSGWHQHDVIKGLEVYLKSRKSGYLY